MQSPKLFSFCPRCAQPRIPDPDERRFLCAGCGFLYYFNPAIAAAGIVRDMSGRVLLVRRASEPAQGRLSLPGGFVEYGETIEEAVRREVFEEVGLRLGDLSYLCSLPNQYPFGGVTYGILDFFFVAETSAAAVMIAPEEVASICWIAPDEIPLEEIAFPSVRAALQQYCSALTPATKSGLDACAGGG